MTLHILSASDDQPGLTAMLSVLAAQDAVLLINDGLKLASGDFLQQIPETVALYRLQPADNRTAADATPYRITDLDMAGWVELCCQHQPILSW